MKKLLVLGICTILLPISTFATTDAPVETTLSNLSKALEYLQTRVGALETEVVKLRKENTDLRSRLYPSETGSVLLPMASGSTVSSASGVVILPPTVSTGTGAKTKYDRVMDYVNANIGNILATAKINGTGSIGLFEFIEPNSFFISLDDGKNPAGVTAFKTKILFQYTDSLKLTVSGVFDLDYGTQKYITVSGSNPFAKATRNRIKNPAYKGKLLEEKIVDSTVVSVTATGVVTPTVSLPAATGTGATLAQVRSAYDKNKLADAISLATAYIGVNGNNVEVLTMRARSYYIIGSLDLAIADVTTIYSLQKEGIDCGIVNDAARAEKSLKGAKGTFFTDIQSAKKCKK